MYLVSLNPSTLRTCNVGDDQTTLLPGFASHDMDQRNGEGRKPERLTRELHYVKLWKMNKKKTLSSNSLNQRQLAYATLRAKGENKSQAYLKAGYKANTIEQAGSGAYKLEQDPRVSQYIKTLQESSFLKEALSVAEKRAFLARAVRADASNPDPDLVQEMVETHGEHGSVKRVKLVSKLEAINIDNKMAGDNFADRQDQAQTNPFLFLVNFFSPSPSQPVLPGSPNSPALPPVLDADIVPPSTT